MFSRRIFIRILSFLSAISTAAGAITSGTNFNYEQDKRWDIER
jgi:hypothetical protein